MKYLTTSTRYSKIELIKILEEEILESKGKCFQGRLSRLINTLSGYHKVVNIQISDNEQIANIVIMLKNKYLEDQLIVMFKKEMQERNYDNNVIAEWIIHIKDSY